MLDEACRQLDALLSDAELDRFAELDYHLANRSGLRHVHLDKPHVLDMPCCIRPVPIKSLFQAHILREIASLRKEANYVTLTLLHSACADVIASSSAHPARDLRATEGGQFSDAYRGGEGGGF